VTWQTEAGRRRIRLTALAWSAAGGLLAGSLLLLIVLPVAGLLFSSSPRQILRGLGDPLVWPAIRLTVLTSTASLLLVVVTGTPLAWVLARRPRPGRALRLAETIIGLPVVLPPAVAGVALLLALGRRGLLGPALEVAGIGLPFTKAAVVLAQSFVAAPFYVQAAVAAFRRLDPELVVVARALGAGPPRVFFTVGVPLSWPDLAGGAALCWARALGEFGATLMFAGNLVGRTQTLPLAIYTALESDLQTAQSLSVVLVAVSVALLFGLRGRARP